MVKFCSRCQIAWPDTESACSKCGDDLVAWFPRSAPAAEPRHAGWRPDPVLLIVSVLAAAAGAMIGGMYGGVAGVFVGAAVGWIAGWILPFGLAGLAG